MQRLNNQRGFSLVELAIGLAIITVLILAISLSAGLRDNARVQSAAQSIQTLRLAAESYLSAGRLNYGGLSIASLKSGSLLPTAFDASASNPWGGSYDIAPTGDKTKFDITLNSVPKTDSSKLLSYFQNSASGAVYDEGKGSLIVSF